MFRSLIWQQQARGLPHCVMLTDLQDILGFANPQAIYKWQHGTALPTLDNLVILANAFDVAMDDIIVVEDKATVHVGA